ncbi:MAG: hypothetical protein LBJ43_05325, partial [Propionibacteriaceae bacterium]|nr:hypothetical protein [Propionibacteriaceae bacterium]
MDSELDQKATLKKFFIVQNEGERKVSRELDHSSLRATTGRETTQLLKRRLREPFQLEFTKRKPPLLSNYLSGLLRRLR